MQKITIELTPFQCLRILERNKQIIESIKPMHTNGFDDNGTITTINSVFTQIKNKIFGDLTIGSVDPTKIKHDETAVDFLTAVDLFPQSLINNSLKK
jgi:hypothetical protein